MYLKKIETKGFKSFADKTYINFESGITGVVGPNGSGKSNVVDAVRWVLGEQSIKQLRGAEHMSDVIFAGSSSRSAHNFAYVAIVLDNSDRYLNLDYDEVEITRKVYRSGESEYLLNKEKCRLKDIHDLILDTGLGKDAFNIISQDRVQSLLNAKPAERRDIFEEAAGVLKYRRRKEKAQRKLEKADENFTRVADILSELENQVEPLRLQSEQAKKYVEMKKNLEAVEIALLAHEISDAKFLLDKNAKLSRSLEDEKIFLENEEYKFESTLKDLNMQVKNLDENMEQINNDIFSLTREVDKTITQQKLVMERKKYTHEKKALDDNYQSLTKEILSLKDNERSLRSRVKTVLDEQASYKSKIAKSDQLITDLKKKKSDILIKVSQLNTMTSKLTSQIKKYESMEKENYHLHAGVREVLHNPTLKGIHDIVGKVINFDEKYQDALEAALGGASQFIISDDQYSVKEAIRYLVKNKLGRATFLPLDNLKIRKVDLHELSQFEYLGIAAEFVQCDEKYQRAIDHLLANVIVCKSLEDAHQINKQIRKYRIVTLDGSVVNTGGSISGGKNSRHANVIGVRHEYETNKRNLIDLEDEITNYLLEVNRLEQNMNQVEDENYQARIKIMQLDENLKYRNGILQDVCEKITDLEKELQSFENFLNDDDEELRLLDLVNNLNDQLSKLKLVLQDDKTKKAQILLEIDECRANLKENNTRLKQLDQEYAKISIENGKIEVRVESYLQKLSDEYEITFERAFSEYELEIDVVDARVKVKRLNRDINRLGLINMHAIEEYEQVSTRYEFLKEQRDDLTKAREDIQETISELDLVMEKEFKTTFDEVSSEFSFMFKQLFGGGHAKLSLIDEHDLLNTGIEIEAQPPGKKLQFLTLLSGGEKALTTLVLLFAILKVRPVPFCILDEVEAALDEANLARFAKFLAEFKMQTQFIIITHRKVTMESTDILYGVTMQESGVSKLVSVKLADAHELVG